MPIRPPEYDRLASEIAPHLINLPPKVIAITGLMLAGKTTIARFLAWYFNISLIETDHYLVPNQGFTYETSEINRIITNRLALPRPVIIEGIKALEILAEIAKPPDIIIYIKNISNINTKEEPEQKPEMCGFQTASYYEVSGSH
jgi:uridine kinase